MKQFTKSIIGFFITLICMSQAFHLLAQSSCSMPSSLFYNQITPTSIELNWTPVSGASQYKIAMIDSIFGVSSTTYSTTTTTTYTRNSLTDGHYYKFKVSAFCPTTGTWSAYKSLPFLFWPVAEPNSMVGTINITIHKGNVTLVPYSSTIPLPTFLSNLISTTSPNPIRWGAVGPASTYYGLDHLSLIPSPTLPMPYYGRYNVNIKVYHLDVLQSTNSFNVSRTITGTNTYILNTARQYSPCTTCFVNNIKSKIRNQIQGTTIFTSSTTNCSNVISSASWSPPYSFTSSTDYRVYIEINGTNYMSRLAGGQDINLSEINLFPNPAKDFININSQQQIESIKIYNMHGSEIYTDATIFDTQKRVDLSTFTTGIYFILINDDRSQIKKFLVQK